MEREEQIKKIAYELWEKEGKPEGRDQEFYFRAEALWNDNQFSEQAVAGLYGQPVVKTPSRPLKKNAKVKSR